MRVPDPAGARAAPGRGGEWPSCGPAGQCWREVRRWRVQEELGGSPVICLSGGWPATAYVVRMNVCACVCSPPGLYIEDEGVAFKNNIFLT